VSITADPPCEVLLDGEPLGLTPLADVVVRPGRYRLLILNSQADVREVHRLRLRPGDRWQRVFRRPSP
jgi:hypothetical protein